MIPKFEDAVTVTWEHDDFKGVTELRVNFSASMLYHVKDGCAPSEYERAKDITVEKLREQVADSATDECKRTTIGGDPFNMFFCDHCLHPLDKSDNFCGGCGRRVTT